MPAWNSAARQRLSAIRHPEQGVPKGFYFDRASALAELGEAVPCPETLTQASEEMRAQNLLSYRGISWRSTSGRNFSREFPAPLFGLWVDTMGLVFALDMLVPDRENPRLEALWRGDMPAFWCGLRRYLFQASEQDYAQAQARIAPTFEALYLQQEDHTLQRLRDLIAFAFSRDGVWPARLLQDFCDGKTLLVEREALLAGALDADLVATAIARCGGGHHFFHYYVFDMVESLEGSAVEILSRFESREAPVRKRVAAALAVAEKLRG